MRSSYYDYKLKASKRYINVLVLITGFINLFLLIPDLTIVPSLGAKISIAIIRAAFFVMLTVIACNVKSINSFKLFSYIITFCEVMGTGILLFVLTQYDNPNFLIQVLGIMTLILIIFLVPNKLQCMLFAALTASAGFFICIYFFITPLNKMEYIASLTYVVIAIVLCAIYAYNTERHQFREFIAKRELERISTTDFLTGTANRLKMIEEAERWISFCKTQVLPLSLVFFDVDNMKTINDQFGHSAGDLVLLNLGRLIQRELRNSDILARWGGDEFVILLPSVDLQNAVDFSMKCEMLVRENITINGFKITCSFGVVGMENNSTFDDLVSKADSLMYEAKQHGKDTVQYAEQID